MLPKNTKRIPTWLTATPPFRSLGGMAVYPFIFLRGEYYDDLRKKKPKAISIYVLIHEQTHIHRAKNHGPILWMVRYAFSPLFRVNEELEADRPAMAFWKTTREPYDIYRRAKFLSSYIYLWPISYKNAKQRLTDLWNSV